MPDRMGVNYGTVAQFQPGAGIKIPQGGSGYTGRGAAGIRQAQAQADARAASERQARIAENAATMAAIGQFNDFMLRVSELNNLKARQQREAEDRAFADYLENASELSMPTDGAFLDFGIELNTDASGINDAISTLAALGARDHALKIGQSVPTYSDLTKGQGPIIDTERGRSPTSAPAPASAPASAPAGGPSITTAGYRALGTLYNYTLPEVPPLSSGINVDEFAANLIKNPSDLSDPITALPMLLNRFSPNTGAGNLLQSFMADYGSGSPNGTTPTQLDSTMARAVNKFIGEVRNALGTQIAAAPMTKEEYTQALRFYRNLEKIQRNYRTSLAGKEEQFARGISNAKDVIRLVQEGQLDYQDGLAILAARRKDILATQEAYKQAARSMMAISTEHEQLKQAAKAEASRLYASGDRDGARRVLTEWQKQSAELWNQYKQVSKTFQEKEGWVIPEEAYSEPTSSPTTDVVPVSADDYSEDVMGPIPTTPPQQVSPPTSRPVK